MHVGRWKWWATVVVAVLAAGCGDAQPLAPGNGDRGPGPDPDPDPDPDPVPEYISAGVTAVSANVISAEVSVRATGFDELFVRAWRAGGVPFTTPVVRFDGGEVASTAVLGLHPDSDYEFEIVLTAAGVEAPVDTLDFSTGTLPAWLPTIVPQGANPTPGLVTLSLPGGPVIIDNSGRVVWYLSAPDPVLNNFQAHPDGTYTLLGRDTQSQEYLVLDELGRETGRLACVNREARFHELRVRSGGDYWIMCNHRRTADLTDLGGLPEVELEWTVVQHVSAAGKLVWEWNSADHFDLTDIPPDVIPGSTAINVTHGNAMAFDTDGNLLVSWREFDEVTKIAAETGDIIWRFGGGPGNQLTFIDDPKGSFERQHGLRVVAPGVIQLLDNGDVAPSRFVRFRIDEQAMTATLLLELIETPETYTPVGGSTDVLPGDGALVSFGRAGRVAEWSASGERTWELTGIDGLYVFRSQRIPSLYAAERRN